MKSFKYKGALVIGRHASAGVYIHACYRDNSSQQYIDLPLNRQKLQDIYLKNRAKVIIYPSNCP